MTMGLQHAVRVEPLGLEAVAGALRGRHPVCLLDLRVTPDRLQATVSDFRPDMLGIASTFTVDTYRALKTAQAAKEVDPGIFVFVGGHHASLQPADFFHSAVDAVVLGEGELTARELADCLEAGGDPVRVPGLALNRPEGQYTTPPRSLVQDLDGLPRPDRTLCRRHRSDYFMFFTSPIALLETARGCPYRCRFCSVWRFYQQRVRFKSPERITDELAELSEPYVFFTDDNFLCASSRAEETARLIRRKGIRKNYVVQARSDAIVRHADTVARWREIGLDCVFIGFEKAEQAGLEGVNKHNSVENNERALEVLRRLGIEPTVSFIVEPEWNRRDFAALRAYVRRLGLRRPMFSVLTPLPGTELFEQARARLTTANYELFDLFHSVLPTRLPLRDFYRELARLWQSAYPAWRLLCLRIYLLASRLLARGPRRRLGLRVLAEAVRVSDGKAYLEYWSGFNHGARWQAANCRPNQGNDACAL